MLLLGDQYDLRVVSILNVLPCPFSMCTMLSLQWEPEIISVSLMYLASRLSKTDIQDWHGKQPGTKIKWYEHFVEGISMELMEGEAIVHDCRKVSNISCYRQL